MLYPIELRARAGIRTTLPEACQERLRRSAIPDSQQLCRRLVNDDLFDQIGYLGG
jgi:hypothetical protein